MADMAEMWGGGVSATEAQRGAWFREMKFAMFIHWGLYSSLAGRWKGKTYYGNAEWIMNRAQIPSAEYRAVAKDFCPVRFDAREWVQLAKDAGMRYIVITAKHHDGFAMYHSQASDFNIVDATPFDRDPLKELAEACADAGLKLGFYYSQFQDWVEPGAAGNSWEDMSGEFDDYLQRKALPQIRELLTHYGPVALIWFDTPGSISPEASRELNDLVHELQPGCLVNSRVGNGFGDYSSAGDQEIPLTIRPGLWESIDTHNDTWGYAVDDENWECPRELVRRLIKIASKGGTYMLNVGPTGEGIIPEGSAAILRDVGAWITPRAEALYGTRPWADASMPWGDITHRGNILYLHVLTPPATGRLWLTGLTGTITKARVVGEPKADTPTFSREAGTLVVDLPENVEDSLATVIAIEMVEPKTTDAPLAVINGMENELNAPFAQVNGCIQTSRRWMEKFGEWHHAECLAQFEAGAAATWRVRTFEPGRFYIVADYATDLEGDGTQFDIQLGDVVRRFLALDTGERPEVTDWIIKRARFRRRRIGMVELPGPADFEICLRQLEDHDTPTIQLRRLALIPVQ